MMKYEIEIKVKCPACKIKFDISKAIDCYTLDQTIEMIAEESGQFKYYDDILLCIDCHNKITDIENDFKTKRNKAFRNFLYSGGDK